MCLVFQTVLILKYVVPGYDEYIYYGGANVGMNAGVMFRYVAVFVLTSGLF
jgi:hypothetical protein